jgi:hypothetical protein
VRIYDYADLNLPMLARMAMELDGAQHLADPIAYRRPERSVAAGLSGCLPL